MSYVSAEYSTAEKAPLDGTTMSYSSAEYSTAEKAPPGASSAAGDSACDAGAGDMDVLTASTLRYDAEAAREGLLEPAGCLAAARAALNDGHFVRILARSLRERDSGPLTDAVRVVGVRTLVEVFAATIETEARGGLFTAQLERRRTPGGVFYHLLRQVVSGEQWKEIFAQRNLLHVRRKNASKRRLAF
jgi:hypothetical protein